MTPIKQFLISFFVILLFFSKLYGQDLFNYENTLKYANHLFNNKQFQNSAIEYERITYLAPNDTLAKLRLVQSFRLMNDFKNAKTYLNKYFPENDSNYPEAFAEENFRILFLDHQYLNCYRFLLENSTIHQTKNTEYKIGTLLMQNKWSEAKTISENYFEKYEKTTEMIDLYDITTKGINQKYKNPYIAALFSGIVPGSGKLYTKQWKDGIYAFLIVSTFSWMTYNSIKNKGLNTGSSILLGSVAFSFYAANIFGSYKSAKTYNNKVNKEITKDVESIIMKR